MGFVDFWPLVNIRCASVFGGRLQPVAAFGRDRGRVSLTRRAYVAVHGGPSGPSGSSAADRSLGNSVGAIGWSMGGLTEQHSVRRSRPGALSVPLPRDKLHPFAGRRAPSGGLSVQDSYLVDSASSHMLVSKIKPCMSKYKQLYRETANGSLNQLSFI